MYRLEREAGPFRPLLSSNFSHARSSMLDLTDPSNHLLRPYLWSCYGTNDPKPSWGLVEMSRTQARQKPPCIVQKGMYRALGLSCHWGDPRRVGVPFIARKVLCETWRAYSGAQRCSALGNSLLRGEAAA